MHILRIAPLAALLAACTGDPATDSVAGNAPSDSDVLAPSGQPTAPRSPAPMPEAGIPPQEQAEQAAAAQVLRRYFALVEADGNAEAASLWWDEEQARAFAARLDRYGSFEPSIAAPQRIEGAAGSLWIDISLQLLRRTASGLQTLSDGTAILRRANAVPGSTAEQRRWRIDRIALQPPPVPLPAPASYRFVGRWAGTGQNCAMFAWRFTADRLTTPAGSVCNFRNVEQVPGGYDIAATCTAEGPPTDDLLELRFAESANALLFESDVIADSALVRCS